MWIFFYTALCGVSAFYAAKQLKKNPYFWGTLGCLLKINVFVILFLIIPITKFFLTLAIRRKIAKRFGSSEQSSSPSEDDVISLTELDENALQRPWYYLDPDNKTQGPISAQFLLKKWKDGSILASTYIWNETLTEWKTVTEMFPQGGHKKRSPS